MFFHLHNTKSLINSANIISIYPKFSIAKRYTLNVTSPENGREAMVAVSSIVGITLFMSQKIGDDILEPELIGSNEISLDLVELPLLQVEGYTSLPDEAPEEKFICSKDSFNKALGKYLLNMHKIEEMLNKVEYPQPITDTTTLHINTETGEIVRPPVTVVAHQPSQVEEKIQKNMDILFSKMNKALNRTFVVKKKEVTYQERGLDDTLYDLPGMVDYLVTNSLCVDAVQAFSLLTPTVDQLHSSSYSMVK